MYIEKAGIVEKLTLLAMSAMAGCTATLTQEAGYASVGEKGDLAGSGAPAAERHVITLVPFESSYEAVPAAEGNGDISDFIAHAQTFREAGARVALASTGRTQVALAAVPGVRAAVILVRLPGAVAGSATAGPSVFALPATRVGDVVQRTMDAIRAGSMPAGWAFAAGSPTWGGEPYLSVLVRMGSQEVVVHLPEVLAQLEQVHVRQVLRDNILSMFGRVLMGTSSPWDQLRAYAAAASVLFAPLEAAVGVGLAEEGGPQVHWWDDGVDHPVHALRLNPEYRLAALVEVGSGGEPTVVWQAAEPILDYVYKDQRGRYVAVFVDGEHREIPKGLVQRLVRDTMAYHESIERPAEQLISKQAADADAAVKYLLQSPKVKSAEVTETMYVGSMTITLIRVTLHDGSAETCTHHVDPSANNEVLRGGVLRFPGSLR